LAREEIIVIEHDKLVRDLIPELIEKAGKECKFRKLEEEEYHHKLKEKLREEVVEYLKSDDFEELADILEVIRALVITHNKDMEALEDKRKKKKESRGAFENRQLLIKAEE
jgi:predicted house-cleaning noncanonical NTP pyrophosphatase (MazG superfamily)